MVTFNLPPLERKYLPLLLTSLIPVLLTVPSNNPELDITTVQQTDDKIESSTIMISLENKGSTAAENIVIFFPNGGEFELTKTFSLDGSEITSINADMFKVNLKRLAPQTYAILNIENEEPKENDTKIVVVHDKGIKQLQIPYFKDKKIAVSSSTFSRDSLVIIGSLIANLSVILILRHILIFRSNELRLQNIGKIDAQYADYWSKLFKLSFWLMISTHFIFLFQTMILNFLAGAALTVSDELTFDVFVAQYSKCGWDIDRCWWIQMTSGTSALLMMTAIWISFILVFSVKIPRHQWFLKTNSYSTIFVNDVSNSLIKPVFVPIETLGMDALKKSEKILILTDDKNIIGLVAKNEIHAIYDIEPEPNISIKKLFENKKIHSPPLDKLSGIRKNYIFVNSNQPLSFIKKEMEEKRVRYSLVVNEENHILGIIDYLRIFEKPE